MTLRGLPKRCIRLNVVNTATSCGRDPGKGPLVTTAGETVTCQGSGAAFADPLRLTADPPGFVAGPLGLTTAGGGGH